VSGVTAIAQRLEGKLSLPTGEAFRRAEEFLTMLVIARKRDGRASMLLTCSSWTASTSRGTP
jgi:hypothetical protein